jgi:hypothetical protein
MRIFVTGVGTSVPLELTGSNPESFVEGLAGPCDWTLQEDDIIGSAAKLLHDRGNVSNVLNYRVSRFWKAADAACLFYNTHVDTVPHLATISLWVISATTGNVTKTLTFTGAIKVTREHWEGSLTIMRYEIKTGQIGT